MRVKSYLSEGIVLARKNYSEADRILVVFSKNFGKLHLLAKGVRKPESKKRGHLEIFTRIKFSASSGKGLDLITEAEILNFFRKTRKDLKKVAVAYFFMEVLGRVTNEGERNENLYEVIIEYLSKLENTKNLKILRMDFIYEVLVTSGFWPKGKEMAGPDSVLEQILERKISSIRVGKKLLT